MLLREEDFRGGNARAFQAELARIFLRVVLPNGSAATFVCPIGAFRPIV